ncbi:hypothetical protein CRG86_007105 [Photobacterium leiognathi]|nr:hypothetical protein CRG86_007105 [Photobacterium leiognathi]
MKVISLLANCSVVSVDSNILIKNSEGQTIKLEPGMELHSGDILLLPDDSNVVLHSNNQSVKLPILTALFSMFRRVMQLIMLRFTNSSHLMV